MNKKFLKVATITGLIAIGLAALVFHWSQPSDYSPPPTEKELAGSSGVPVGPSPQTQTLLKPIDLSKPIRLAVGGMGLADNELDRQLADLTTVQLTGAPGFTLVERNSLDAVLRELNLSWSGFVRAKDAVQVGKLLKVDWFLLGTQSRINGTNSLVVRMVDAHTGVMRDAEIFPSDNSPTKLAADLAGFARRTRDDAAKARMRVYLAVGGFADLSQNNRRADFLPQLRGYLTAGYRGGNVTLLEREYVETLLREMHLDIAGLTQEDETNTSTAAQSAFWLVGGEYQSYETTNYQVEVTLKVQRVFGRAKHVALRGPAGDAIDKQIKDAIDEAISSAAPVIIPTRLSEARVQIASGKELLGLPALASDSDLFWNSGGWILDSGLAELRKRNVEEAVRSFETALLLEPTNREVKVYLGLSLRNSYIGKIEEARRYYFEIINDSVSDRWLEIAKRGLLQSFAERATLMEPNPAVAAPWYEAAALNATNLVGIQYFRSQAEDFRAKLNLQNDPVKKQEIAFANVFSSITNAWHERRYINDLGIGDYLGAFGTNRAAAAYRLNESYSKFTEQAPELSQYILASIVIAQVDTNASVVVEFKKMLDDLAIHPDRISDPTNFWQNSWTVSQWSFQYKDYDLAIKLLEGKIRFRSERPKVSLGYDELSDDKLALAYAYADVRKWDRSLAIFESFDNQAVRAHLEGPWGTPFALVFPQEFAEICREKLGLPSQRDSREFSMGKAAFSFGLPSTFTVDGQGVWFGGAGELIHLDFELKTNDIIKLPLDDFAPVTAICIASSNIWIGTDGGGLIEYDKDSKKSRRFTVQDGMLMDAVTALNFVGDTLWIGYGRGLGKLEIPDHHFVSFARPMTLNFISKTNNSNVKGTVMPIKSAVIKLAGAEKDNVWMLTDGANPNPVPQLFQYRSKGDTWIAGDEGPAMDADAKHLVVGQYRTPPVSIQNLKDGQWRGLNASTNLPTGLLTAITLDGDNVWVGGVRFVAQLDAAHDKMIHFAYLKAGSVDRIQLGGGYVWAQCGWLLYRAPIPH